MLPVSIEEVACHVGMGGLLDYQPMASVTADCIPNDAGGGGPQDHDSVAAVIFDDVRLWDSVARLHDAEMDGRTSSAQSAVDKAADNLIAGQVAKLKRQHPKRQQ